MFVLSDEESLNTRKNESIISIQRVRTGTGELM